MSRTTRLQCSCRSSCRSDKVVIPGVSRLDRPFPLHLRIVVSLSAALGCALHPRPCISCGADPCTQGFVDDDRDGRPRLARRGPSGTRGHPEQEYEHPGAGGQGVDSRTRNPRSEILAPALFLEAVEYGTHRGT